jgi:glutathione S-transferase
MILYGSSLSPFVRKVLAVAAEKGVDIDLQPAGAAPGQRSEEFLEASPFGKMPALRDGDFTLADSSAIVHYIEAKHPQPALIPTEPQALGKTIWFEEFADTILGACCAKMFYNRVVAPRFFGRPGDEEAAAAAERDELPPMLAYFEKVAPEGQGFLLGETVTLADIAVATVFANFDHMNVEIDAGRYPRTVAYVTRILARPSFAPWIEREKAMLQPQAA